MGKGPRTGRGMGKCKISTSIWNRLPKGVRAGNSPVWKPKKINYRDKQVEQMMKDQLAAGKTWRQAEEKVTDELERERIEEEGFDS